MPVIPATSAPTDPVFHLAARYKADHDPKKVDLAIGAYRDNEGKPWVLPVVQKVDEQLVADAGVNHEYQPLIGNPEFLVASAKLLFGADTDLSKIASAQTLSGTGALHMAAMLLHRFPPYGVKDGKVWVPTPTWSNHHQIFSWDGLAIESYPYWNAAKRALDFEAMIARLESDSKHGDVLLLHACAHNPTGVDPTRDQWKRIAELAKAKGLFVVFDIAYQGFASGDIDGDAWAVRYFVDQQIDLLACQSFSKNMGLYGERCGAVHVRPVSASAEDIANIASQLALQTRAQLSTTPAYGSRIATKILTDKALYQQWCDEVKLMADRIISMRHALRANLEKLNTPGTWAHITDQIGMFSFTGLTPAQCKRLSDEFHIYLLANGRISMAGVNSSNVEYIAECINKVIVEDTGKL